MQSSSSSSSSPSPSSSSLGRFVVVLVVLVLALWAGHTQSASVARRHYAGRIPMGVDVKVFLQICQLCGEFYGTEYSSSCVHDKSFKTFVLCMTSVRARR